MKTFRKHLNEKLKDEEFKSIYNEEREVMEIFLQLSKEKKSTG